MSLLRARCPDCRTLTAVFVDTGYGIRGLLFSDQVFINL